MGPLENYRAELLKQLCWADREFAELYYGNYADFLWVRNLFGIQNEHSLIEPHLVLGDLDAES